MGKGFFSYLYILIYLCNNFGKIEEEAELAEAVARLKLNKQSVLEASRATSIESSAASDCWELQAIAVN